MSEYQSANFEVQQRIAEATGRPVEDPAIVDLLSEEMNANLLSSISSLDNDPDAKMLAQSAIETFVKKDRMYVGEPNGTTLLALFAFDPSVAFVLIALDDWESLAQNKFPRMYRSCDVRCDKHCDDYGNINLAIKRNEIVCLFMCCNTCRAWFDLDSDTREQRRHESFTTDCLQEPFPDRERIAKPIEIDPWS